MAIPPAVIVELVGADRLRMGTADITLTRMVRLPEAEWLPLRERIRQLVRV